MNSRKMLTPPPPPPPQLTQLIINSSVCNNTMLAAILSLILVFLFILLLQVCAKWFLSQSHPSHPTSSHSSSSLGFSLRPYLIGSSFHPFHDHTFNTPHPHPHSNPNSPNKGLEPSVISSIPLFTYQWNDKSVLECVVCLTAFEDGEVGRRLCNCGHHFHVECIDMWLHSHSTCPICRVPVICEGKIKAIDNGEGVMEIRVEIPNSESENVVVNASLSDSSSSSSLPLSIKRMVGKNRVESNVTELDA